jgi:aspartate kinase
MRVVQKYGGTSVADAERVKHVAARIAERKKKGDEVIVVVSAMGNRTDELITLARSINPSPPPRELDLLLSTGEQAASALLAMALNAIGQDAVGLSGRQTGIISKQRFGDGRISRIEEGKIEEVLARGAIPIIAGFQGITETDEIVTLGRGASDLTAVALSIALKADSCETFKDVEGVFSADPRVVKNAKKIKEIGYEEMLEMATQGSQVMHSRAIELAAAYNMPIRVASSMNTASGTLIHGGNVMEERNRVRGVVGDMDVAKITLRSLPDEPGIAVRIFEPLAAAGISVDTIVQNASEERLTDLTFTIAESDLEAAEAIMPEICEKVRASGYVADARLAKVSIVGAGIQSEPGYAAQMFKALYRAGINIEMISTSEIRLTCIVSKKHLDEAVEALHKEFVSEFDKKID